ncbi:MAG: AIPR family protein [Neomegalonema sp.]|nr:AIPR family protein [Neomegalonema sp.]
MALSTKVKEALQRFGGKYELAADSDVTFELFATHTMLRHRQFTEASSLRAQGAGSGGGRREPPFGGGDKRLLVGGANDAQIDAIALLMNGEPIFPESDISRIAAGVESDDGAQFEFIFVQATGEKRQKDRLTHKMSAFSDGVLAVLHPQGVEHLEPNAQVRAWAELFATVFALINENELEHCCSCSMYYVAPNIPDNDDNVTRACWAAEQKIRSSFGRYFEHVDIRPVGNRLLENIIDDLETLQRSMSLPLGNFCEAPMIDGRITSLIGYLSLSEVIEAISIKVDGKAAELRAGLFAANVREYLGPGGRVNASIAETLQQSGQRQYFGLLNNGLSIIADAAERTADGQITLDGAQIVNGCQTCNTLFAAREHILETRDSGWVPARIMIGSGDDLRDQIVVSLNRQNQFDETRLFADRSLVERIAEELEKTPPEARLFLEQREGQYSDRTDIERERRFTLYDLATSYTWCFRNIRRKSDESEKQIIQNEIKHGIIFARHHSVHAYVFALELLHAGRLASASIQNKAWQRYPLKKILIQGVKHIAEIELGASLSAAAFDDPAIRDQAMKFACDRTLAQAAADCAAGAVQAASARAQLQMIVKNKDKQELLDETKYFCERHWPQKRPGARS